MEANKPDVAVEPTVPGPFVSTGGARFTATRIQCLLLACVLGQGVMPVQSLAAADSVQSDQDVRRFGQSAPYATAVEIKRRFGFKESSSKYEIGGETFQVIVPGTFRTNSTWGLLVWISPGDDVRIPADWRPELERHRLLLVGARNSGNNRDATDRARLALDAACNMCRQFKVDRQRIYIAGFSGGARMASMIGVAYPDIFTGTFSVCGVNFYRDVKADAGRYYPAGYHPDARLLPLAKKSGRFVLLTGENDMNRENTMITAEKGFIPDGFSQVLYLEVPGMNHALPGAANLNTALDYLDSGNKPRSPSNGP